MRVLYFSQGYTPHDFRFLDKLSRCPHEVWFLRLAKGRTTYEGRPLPEGIHPVEEPLLEEPVQQPEGYLTALPGFEAVLDRVQPQLVHAGPVQSCGFITALSGFHPFLLMSWGSDILRDADRDRLWNWTTRHTLVHSDMLLCDCRAVRARVQQMADYPDEEIVQFPWGVDLEQFAPGADRLGLRQRPGWEDSFVVLSTRSWEPVYGIETLLDAFHHAYQINPRLRLALVGDGSLAPRVQRIIEDRSLDRVVYRPGMIPNQQLPDYFRAADLYLSCSFSDGSSVSLLEALATGLPVVVSDAPGNREWVCPGENGWLARTGDAADTAAMVLQATDLAASQLQRRGRNNRRVAEERANWDRNSEKLLKAYARLASRSRG